LHIARLRLRLPADYAAEAESIGHAVARGLARLPITRSHSLEALQLGALQVPHGASAAQLSDAVVRQVAAALQVPT
jgi:hypothetical protein